MPTVLFAGGGSIGHIAPAVSVARALQKKDPSVQVHFVCSTRGEDTRFLKDEKFSFDAIDAPRISLMYPFKLLRARKHVRKILNEVQPDVIFSKGGYVSIPVCLEAKKKNIPIVLHESDAVSGRANRLVSRWAEAVCLGFPKDKTSPKETVTGNPVRSEVIEGTKEEGQRITGFKDRPVLLVTGGSQGSEILNDAVTNHLKELTEMCDIIHLTGRGKRDVADRPHYFSREFVHEELPHFYAMSDLALSRAGANNINDLAANGVPTILVPLRHVGHDHQYQNALIAEQGGGVTLLDQERLDSELLSIVELHLKDGAKREEMSRKIRELHYSDAPGQISEIIHRFLA